MEFLIFFDIMQTYWEHVENVKNQYICDNYKII